MPHNTSTQKETAKPFTQTIAINADDAQPLADLLDTWHRQQVGEAPGYQGPGCWRMRSTTTSRWRSQRAESFGSGQPRQRWLWWCAALSLAGACSAAPPAPAPTPGAFDESALPICQEQPSPPPLPDIPGLTLPDEAAVFSTQELGPVTQAEGVVDMTPVDVRAYYEGREDLQLLSVEDERVEAEILVTDGTHRMFVKAQILCATASNFTATVGTEEDSGAVPVPPAGTPGPSGSG